MLLRFRGRITQWNDDKGFGFVSCGDGHAPVFLHVTAFGSRGRRPEVGDSVTYEVVADGRRRQRAAKATFISSGAPTSAGSRAASRSKTLRQGRTPWLPFWTASAVTALVIVGWLVSQSAPWISSSVESSFKLTDTAETTRFRCEGKTRCTQMSSCEEATFYIRNCPDTQMDGDNDGVPCESQWCWR